VTAASSRRPAAELLALLALLAALAVALAVVVPWTTLPGSHPVPDPRRDFTAAQIAREVAFHDQLRPPAYASLGLGVLVAVLLGLTPVGARLLRAVARPLGGGWVWQVLLGTPALLLLGRLVTLPLDLRVETVLRRFGLSTQAWRGWAADQAKAAAIAALLTTIVVLLLVGLARLAPRTWWIWGAGATAVLVVAGSFVYPLVVEPVFLRFTPLPAGPLREDLLGLAQRAGVPVQDVLVADASRRTTALNAYVSGFGSTRRLVVYDTLLNRAPPPEVRLVVAHELGHARAGDVLTGTLLSALGAAAGVCGLALVVGRRSRLRRGDPADPGNPGDPADPAVVPLVLALAAVAGLLVAPVGNLVSRRIEARADVASLDLTGDVGTFVAIQRRLALTNLSDLEPNPVADALFATHPSTTQRIALAREWERLAAAR